MHSGDYIVRPAERRDLYGVLVVQLDAFGRVARELRIPKEQLPPLNEPLNRLEELFDSGTRFWVAVTDDHHIIGSVRATELPGGRIEVGRLVVAHEHVRKGVASALMAALEASYPEATNFELFTGKDAESALALYGKLGYQVSREEPTPAVTLVWMEKPNPASPQT